MNSFATCRVFWFALLVCAITSASAQESTREADTEKPGDALRTARVHLQRGRYEEAIEACDEAVKAKADPAVIAILRSEAFEAEGRWKEATDALIAATKSAPRSVSAWGRLAELRFRQGDFLQAEKDVAQALKLDAKDLRAKLVQADVFTETGRLKEAGEAYRGIVRYYNQAQPEDAETLMLVGRGSAQYARWNNVTTVFNFLVNTLCPDAVKNDANCWQAWQLSGDLLLEKYNREQSVPDLKKALSINPRSAEVLASLAEAAMQENDYDEVIDFADQALKIDPSHRTALGLKADVAIARGQLADAHRFVDEALNVNPRDQRLLARQAAIYLLNDGIPSPKEFDGLLSNLDALDQVKIDNPSRFSKLVMELARRNPRPGYFLSILGDALAKRRQYESAERVYRHAVAVMPQLSSPKNELGMLYMRTGQMDEAKRLLEDAFKADPYHVRVSNMRKVLKLLDGYGTLSTEHFVIRYDTDADRILAREMAEYLEEIYPGLVKQFGYEPEARTQFELYNKAKGLSAHQWFSARMVGLPWIQTIGASTGVIIALASPTATEQGFNWARVAKHEFVHVVTLQQTKFNIPHWFTEALAVTSEETPRPAKWDELLLARVPKGELRVLDELNDGFQRPKSPDDWQFAYCQSRLYAQYIIEKFGNDKIAKMLDGYRENKPTDKLIPEVFVIEKAEFEKGYREFLGKIVAQLKSEDEPEEESKTPAELEKAHLADPDDSKAAAAYAFALLEAGKRKEARELAEKAIGKNPKERDAVVVLSLLDVREEEFSSAAKRLEAILDRAKPNRSVLLLLAKIKVKDEKLADAAELYELGRKAFPRNVDILKALAAVYTKLDEGDALEEVMGTLAERDPDDVVSRKKLAEIALERKDFEKAARFAREAIFVNVLDPDTHRILGKARVALGQPARAIPQLQTAMELSPKDPGIAVELAIAQLAAGDRAAARTTIDGVLKDHPDHEAAKTLADKLKE